MLHCAAQYSTSVRTILKNLTWHLFGPPIWLESGMCLTFCNELPKGFFLFLVLCAKAEKGPSVVSGC
jgi:hypothetical protein